MEGLIKHWIIVIPLWTDPGRPIRTFWSTDRVGRRALRASACGELDWQPERHEQSTNETSVSMHWLPANPLLYLHVLSVRTERKRLPFGRRSLHQTDCHSYLGLLPTGKRFEILFLWSFHARWDKCDMQEFKERGERSCNFERNTFLLFFILLSSQFSILDFQFSIQFSTYLFPLFTSYSSLLYYKSWLTFQFLSLTFRN